MTSSPYVGAHQRRRQLAWTCYPLLMKLPVNANLGITKSSPWSLPPSLHLRKRPVCWPNEFMISFTAFQRDTSYHGFILGASTACEDMTLTWWSNTLSGAVILRRSSVCLVWKRQQVWQPCRKSCLIRKWKAPALGQLADCISCWVTDKVQQKYLEWSSFGSDSEIRSHLCNRYTAATAGIGTLKLEQFRSAWSKDVVFNHAVTLLSSARLET